MPRLIASKRFAYAGKRLKAGDEFDARDADARLLSIIGSATYATRDLKAGTLSLPKTAPPAEKSRPAPTPAAKPVLPAGLRLPPKAKP